MHAAFPGARSRAMTTETKSAAVASALRTLELERKGLTALEEALTDGLGEAFSRAVETIHRSTGRVIVTGMGKSGHIGRKLAATLASTGQPAFFVHPAEASHGDLGMLQNGDVVLALSWSGETAELAAIVTFAKRFTIPLVAMTSRADSALESSNTPTQPNPLELISTMASAIRAPKWTRGTRSPTCMISRT